MRTNFWPESNEHLGGTHRPVQRCEPTLDEHPVPLRAVLVVQENRLSVGSRVRPQARGLDLHQRH